MHIKLRARLEVLKKTPRSRLPVYMNKHPVYYQDGNKKILCPACANDVCSAFDKDTGNPQDIPKEFHVAWFPGIICICGREIKGVYDE